MKIISTKVTDIKMNPNNPRLIKDEKFHKLVKSIKEFPQMLEIRPIVVNNDMIVLGGNMRLKACIEAGLKEVPVIKANDLTQDQQREFIIKDNIGFGEWDWSMIANEWDDEVIKDWGLDIPNFEIESEVDVNEYSATRTRENLLDIYNNSAIKQIVLHYETEEFEYMARKLDDIGKIRDLDDNSSVVKFLVDNYLANDNSDTEPQ